MARSGLENREDTVRLAIEQPGAASSSQEVELRKVAEAEVPRRATLEVQWDAP